MDEAIAEYSTVIAKTPMAASLMGRSLAYARKGDAARSAVDRAEALRLDPDVQIRFAEYGVTR